jgi:hypothetical protein
MDVSLAYSPKQRAELLTAAFASCSAAPNTLSDAQDEVLSALLLDKPCLTVLVSAATESAGDGIVTEGEAGVTTSLPSHRAPGEDDLPLDLWRLADGARAPVLARLCCALFQRQRTPCQFTLGRITAPLARSFLPELARSKRRHCTCPAGQWETAFSTRNWLRRTCPNLGSVGPWSCWTLPTLSTPLITLSFSHSERCGGLAWRSWHAPMDLPTGTAHTGFCGCPP